MEKPFEEVILDALEPVHLNKRQRREFLRIIRDELELRVGTRLGQGITEAQNLEFQAIVDGPSEKNRRWLEANFPNYPREEAYKSLREQGLEGGRLYDELASILWLRTNRPDYRPMVEACVRELRDELATSRHLIIRQNGGEVKTHG